MLVNRFHRKGFVLVGSGIDLEIQIDSQVCFLSSGLIDSDAILICCLTLSPNLCAPLNAVLYLSHIRAIPAKLCLALIAGGSKN